MSKQRVIYQARLHWVIFVWPVVLLFCGFWLSFSGPSFREIGLIAVLISLAWGILMWLTYQFSSLTIKEKQVILRSGILVRQTIDIPFTKIESIDIRQSIIGSLFRYGTLLITGTGGTRQWMGYLAKPLTCRRHIEQLMHK